MAKPETESTRTIDLFHLFIPLCAGLALGHLLVTIQLVEAASTTSMLRGFLLGTLGAALLAWRSNHDRTKLLKDLPEDETPPKPSLIPFMFTWAIFGIGLSHGLEIISQTFLTGIMNRTPTVAALDTAVYFTVVTVVLISIKSYRVWRNRPAKKKQDPFYAPYPGEAEE